MKFTYRKRNATLVPMKKVLVLGVILLLGAGGFFAFTNDTLRNRIDEVTGSVKEIDPDSTVSEQVVASVDNSIEEARDDAERAALLRLKGSELAGSDPDKAIEALEESLAIEKSVDAYVSLYTVYTDQEDSANALQTVDKAILYLDAQTDTDEIIAWLDYFRSLKDTGDTGSQEEN